ncbi:MAG: hypothetical protein HC842_01055 [Cytophagales bacterium]|nr:hypothetical protein [Cytophagales bacterium]
MHQAKLAGFFLAIFLVLSGFRVQASGYKDLHVTFFVPDFSVPPPDSLGADWVRDSVSTRSSLDTTLRPPQLDSLRLVADSLGISLDSALSLHQTHRDSLDHVVPPGDIKTTIFYNARDSINMDLKSKNIYLYGESDITYGDIKLEAEQTRINYQNRELFANGVEDTASGKLIGKPVFTDKDGTYQTRQIKYNFGTRRAYIQGVITEQGEGFIHSEEIKKK